MLVIHNINHNKVLFKNTIHTCQNPVAIILSFSNIISNSIIGRKGAVKETKFNNVAINNVQCIDMYAFDMERAECILQEQVKL